MALAPNGDMYWCQVDNNTFEVYKSTDGGGTWAFYLLQRGHTERQFPVRVVRCGPDRIDHVHFRTEQYTERQ